MTKKIAVIGANGKAGSLLVEEALGRGYDVTAIVRNEAKNKKVNVLKKDLFDLTYNDLKDFDVVIDAFGVWADEVLKHKTSLRHLSDILKGHEEIRLLVVGGAGSLYVDLENKVRLMDTEDFPEIFKSVATAMGEAFDELKETKEVNWTYLSPAANFVAEGIRTGKYKLGKEELLVNSKGESEISYADYAIALIDEIENANFIKARFTVVAE